MANPEGVSTMTNIGIVGSSSALRTPELVNKLKLLLGKYNANTTVVVSGGGKGLDLIAASVAREEGFEVKEFKPTVLSWNGVGGFHERNMQIAAACEHVYSFVFPVNTHGKPNCYHCPKAGKDGNHEKSAGCYTGMHCKGGYTAIVV